MTDNIQSFTYKSPILSGKKLKNKPIYENLVANVYRWDS